MLTATRAKVVPLPRQWTGPTPAGTSPIDLMGARLSFPRNSEIYCDEDPAEFVYKVVSGAVRISKILSDGRRQISAFQLPGDTFGLEAGENHRFSAEAVADSIVTVVKRSALMSVAERDVTFAHELWQMTARELDRAHEHMLLLGRKCAVERVAAFLVDTAERGRSVGRVDLAMSRQDMADYLGLTIETVSRTLTQLEQRGVIALEGSRHIVFANPAALARLNA